MSFSDLKKKVPDERLTLPERVELYLLLMVTSGDMIHTLDFVDYTLPQGSLVVVRPGQVQQWHPTPEVEAQIVLVDPTALPFDAAVSHTRELELLTLFDWQPQTQLGDELRTNLEQIIGRLESDIAGFDGSELEISLIRHELLALLFRLACFQHDLVQSQTKRTVGYEKYKMFIELLEQHYRVEHALQFYAKRLGYATSTLSRACLEIEGYSAKVVIDHRIALEGKRMLAHSGASVAEIAHYLGFSEATNFIKFFKRNVNLTPTEFRSTRSGR
ncbi:AraC family transcriptional regulator [Pontibacterium granulatum]|uniref:AraC family transcriptional regulator n=1 Tax=Pontibacterium granulatum TaxID=2036029 RepID=UPI00249B3370|nr:helix-turn-helix domain-containing protein [Pontibacterium granulatum]